MALGVLTARRNLVAATVAAAGLAVPFAAPAGAEGDLPCVVVSVGGRSLEVCEDFVTARPCPFPASGVIVDVMGEDVEVCFTKAAG